MKLRLLIIVGLLLTLKPYFLQDFFILNGKKNNCKDLKVENSGNGYVEYIEYIDYNGANQKIKVKNQKPLLTSYYIDSSKTYMDRVPQKTNKPDKYIRFQERIVDGPIMVYIGRQKYNDGTGSYMGVYRFFVKINDVFYDFRKKKDYEDFILPYLKKCKEFTSNFQGNFNEKLIRSFADSKSYTVSEQNYIEMFKLYNSLCD